MSDSSWSSNPNAPQIPYSLYFAEKANFAGILIGGVFYGMQTCVSCLPTWVVSFIVPGIVIVLFFQCMGALFSPPNRRAGVKWGPVIYTTLMFAFATIFTAMNLDIQSISYIDNREYAGDDNKSLPPGPLGYQYLIYSRAISVVPNLMFLLNNWLADGLLVSLPPVRTPRGLTQADLSALSLLYYLLPEPVGHRLPQSHVSRFSGYVPKPSTSPRKLRLTADAAMGILFIYQTSQPDNSIWSSVAISFGIPYFSISLSLNMILTLLIVTRLVLHNRNVRTAMGVPPGFGGLYKAIVTMLVESSALYAVSSLLFVAPWGAGSHVADIFLPILAETQVGAFLFAPPLAANAVG